MSKSPFKTKPGKGQNTATQHIGKTRPEQNSDCMPKPKTARRISQR